MEISPSCETKIVVASHTHIEGGVMPKVLIKNGLVISPTGVIANDVLIDGEKIAAVGAPGWFASSEQGCDRVIDAAGKYVIPGGVDVHTHMELPFGGTFASDTFETGSRAAAWGGVTTIIDMAVQRYGENVFDGLAEWHRKASGECAIDYAFHQIIGGVDDQSLKDMKYLTEHEGISSFKLFMAYPGVFYSDDGQILDCGAHLSALRRTGSGKFTIGQCMPLEQIEALSLPEIQKRLIPIYEAAPSVAL